MHENAAYAHDIGSLRRAQNGVLQERGAETFALPGSIDRQPAENGHGHRIWHVAADRTRRIDKVQRSSRQAIVADDPPSVCNDICARGSADLIGARPAAQPIVKRGMSALKEVKFMRFGQKRGSCERQLRQGRGAFIKRSKPSPPGGRSSTAR